MTKGEVDPIETSADDLLQIVELARTGSIGEERYITLKAVVEKHIRLVFEIERQETTIDNLRRMLFGPTSERFHGIPKEPSSADDGSDNKDDADKDGGQDGGSPKKCTDQREKAKSEGHGRNGVDAYIGAEEIEVPHESLKAGDLCPHEGCAGAVYEYTPPEVTVHVQGQAPLAATKYSLQRLRCGSCTGLFTAKPPKGAERKYDESAAAMIAILRYGRGMPFHRLKNLQRDFGIPLPASTQWDLMKSAGPLIQPVYEELVREAAKGDVMYTDDTKARILTLMGKRRAEREESGEDLDSRKGVRTSGIVSMSQGRKINLFFTGPNHAGDNLEAVLRHRSGDLDKPIQMCDPLSHNVCGDFETYESNCNMHARRPFFKLLKKFPETCDEVLSTYREVYKHDAEAKGMSDERRMYYHRRKSKPMMDKMQRQLCKLIKTKQVEENSLLGESIAYVNNHWKKFTLFLRRPGVPLDNGACERALKNPIIHRNNSLFYMSEDGAKVGDMFMSLIFTAIDHGVNSLEYLTRLLKHAKEAQKDPVAWMPWNYKEALLLPTDP